jgi:hypothetical protein
MRLVEQDPHQLGTAIAGCVSLSWMAARRERAPVRVAAAEAPDQIGQRAGDEEVLLDEAQPLAARRRVVGIEHPGQGLGGERPASALTNSPWLNAWKSK